MTTIRDAKVTDAEGVHAIYAPIVERTAISFETTPPTVDEMAARITSTVSRLPWLVADHDGHVVGYAYASPFNDRDAYLWSVATSVYVAPAAHRRGVGRDLYGELLRRLRGQGYVNAFAGIALPNRASVGLHEAFGFRPAGVFRGAGFKLGAWHDVGWWSLMLREASGEPEPPRPPTAAL